MNHYENKPLYSIDAEQALLGAVLSGKEYLDKVESIVSVADFYHGNHRTIYANLFELYRQNSPYDIVTLAQYLEDKQLLKDVGDREYLATLAYDYASFANVEAYAKIIRDKSILRQMVALSNQIERSCYHTEGKSSIEVIDEIEKSFTAISLTNSQGEDNVVSVTQALSSTLNHLEKLINAEGGITGHPTKWHDFDDKTLGLHGGDMIVIAGRPSMGKTTFALNMVERVTTNTELPSLVFSMEMPKEQLMLKLLSSVGSIDQTALRSGKMGELDIKKLKDATVKLNKLPIHIDDRGLLTVADIRSTARKFIRQHGKLGVIMIDYLQLIHTTGKQSELRAIEVAEISRSLKLLARELNVPVVVLSQLNRSLEQRPNKRPIMSDIRESGAIEQDADNIFFIYRDEVYNENSQDKGIADIIIGKQRNGPIGTIKLAFQNNYSRFMNLSRDLLDLY